MWNLPKSLPFYFLFYFLSLSTNSFYLLVDKIISCGNLFIHSVIIASLINGSLQSLRLFCRICELFYEMIKAWLNAKEFCVWCRHKCRVNAFVRPGLAQRMSGENRREQNPCYQVWLQWLYLNYIYELHIFCTCWFSSWWYKFALLFVFTEPSPRCHWRTRGTCSYLGSIDPQGQGLGYRQHRSLRNTPRRSNWDPGYK